MLSRKSNFLRLLVTFWSDCTEAVAIPRTPASTKPDCKKRFMYVVLLLTETGKWNGLRGAGRKWLGWLGSRVIGQGSLTKFYQTGVFQPPPMPEPKTRTVRLSSVQRTFSGF